MFEIALCVAIGYALVSMVVGIMEDCGNIRHSVVEYVMWTGYSLIFLLAIPAIVLVFI